jgi:acyl-CoA synthetase (AMP-forming)/AMP-acid ligase II
LIALKWPADTTLRFLLTGADILHHYPAADLPFPLVNNYGPTECTVVSTSGMVPALHAEPFPAMPSIGKPITETRIFILDENLHPVADGAAGELCIAGPGVSAGYLGDDELTAEKFVLWPSAHPSQEKLYRTGDLARVRNDGEIDFLGRIDDQIKIDGHRVEPGEICAVVCTNSAVNSCIVTASESSSGRKYLVAYLVLDAAIDAATLRKYLLERLPAYMVPAAFVRLESFPSTAAGKIDRSVLPAPTSANTLSEETTASSLTSTQSRVTSILAQLLNADRIQSTDNFFLLGGHSLLGAQLIAQIHEAFGVALTLRDIFDHPTVQGISLQIDRALTSPAISVSQTQESLPWESPRDRQVEL